VKTINWQTPVNREVDDKRLKPGCWVESKRFGVCVLIAIREGWFDVRYEANHLATSTPLWVGSTDDEVLFHKPSNDKSREVLASKGAFGIGEGRSDPRLP